MNEIPTTRSTASVCFHIVTINVHLDGNRDGSRRRPTQQFKDEIVRAKAARTGAGIAVSEELA